MFTPSKYQQAVFEWVTNGTGHAVIKAVPGSGKSTTLLQASKLLRTDKAVFLAFNASIAKELNEKLEGMGSPMKAQTINSFGFGALRATGMKYKVDGKKYRNIVKDYLQAARLNGYSAYEYNRLQKLEKLVSLSRMTLTDPSDEEALYAIVEHHDIDFDRMYDKAEWLVIWKGVSQIIEAGEQQAKELGIIDFDDQVVLPVRWNLTPDKKDFIFVDESQDLNAARLELIIRSVNGRGRLLFVGDENQSIYGFSGADTQSMNKIIERTHATVLPLSICYRCPSSHIELCASIVPGLEPRENAPKGTIETIKPEKLYDIVKPGDLILCRLNAPLVSTCLELIRSGVRAKVRGSDIGANFVNTIKKLQKQMPRLSIHTFPECITSYRHTQAIMIGIGEDSDMKIAALDDRVDTMQALYEAYCTENPDTYYWTMESFYTYIENFFSDERGPLVILSTVHKAKGLEENRVFILKPETMPHPKAKPGWQYEQEMNIQYVAYSRSKDALYFVDDRPVQIVETPPVIDAIHQSLIERSIEIITPAIIDEQLVTPDEKWELEYALIKEEMDRELGLIQPIVEAQVEAEEKKEPAKRGRKKLNPDGPYIRSKALKQYSLEPDLAKAIAEGGKIKFDGAKNESDLLTKIIQASPLYQELLAKLAANEPGPEDDGPSGGQPAPESHEEESTTEPTASAPANVLDMASYRHRADIANLFDVTPIMLGSLNPHSDLVTVEASQVEETINPPAPVQPALFASEGGTEVVRMFFKCENFLRYDKDGKGEKCGHRWGRDYYVKPDGLRYRIDEGKVITPIEDLSNGCPKCRKSERYIRTHILTAHYHEGTRCTASCKNATSDDCKCSCGGANHGKNNMIGTLKFEGVHPVDKPV